MKHFIQIFTLCLAFAICLSMAACSSADSNFAPDLGAEVDESSSIVNNDLDRKIIYTVTMRLTAKDVASVKTDITSKSNALGGYVESNNESYEDGKCTYATITYRIPTDKLDEFVASIEGHGGVDSKKVSTTDITTSYVNSEAKKNSLLERKQLLEEMLNEDGISTSDRLSIINEISEVNTQIQEIELLLKGYDSDVDYSTINLTINQAASFIDVFAPILIFFILPAMIGLFFIVRGAVRRKKRTKTVKENV